MAANPLGLTVPFNVATVVEIPVALLVVTVGKVFLLAGLPAAADTWRQRKNAQTIIKNKYFFTGLPLYLSLRWFPAMECNCLQKYYL